MNEIVTLFHLKDLSCTYRAYSSDILNQYYLLLQYLTLTCDARANSGSALVFASTMFLFEESGCILQSIDLKEKTSTSI